MVISISDQYDKIAELRLSDTNEALLYYVSLYEHIVGVLQVTNQDTVARTYRIAIENADNPCGSAGGDSFIAYDKELLPKFTHKFGPLNLGAGISIKVRANVADQIDFVLSGLFITTKNKSILSQMNIDDGIDKYAVTSWGDVSKWPIIYLHHDDTYQRLMIVSSFNRPGDKWLYNIVVVNTSETPWVLETALTDTTDPAVLDAGDGAYYVWWNACHGYGLNLVIPSSWLIRNRNFVTLFNYYYDPMLLKFNFENAEEYGVEANVVVTWMSATLETWGGIIGTFYEGVPYDIFQMEDDGTFTHRNRVWCAFMSGSTGTYHVQIGYIDLNDPEQNTPLGSASWIPYFGTFVEILSLFTESAIRWPFVNVCYETGGVFDSPPAYLASDTCLYLKPDENYIALTGTVTGASKGFCLVWDMDGVLLKNYIFSNYADFPILGIMSPIIKNGILYASVYHYSAVVGEEDKKGMIVINLNTDSITYKSPGYECKNDYQLRDLKLIENETQILMASFLDGFVIYDIATDTWLNYNNDNTDSLFLGQPSENELFTVASDDTRDILIGAPTGTYAGWGGITALQREDIDMTDTYDKLASLRPSDTNENELYEVPTDTEIVGLLHVCNQSAVARTYSVAFTDASGAAENDDWTRKDTELLPNLEHRIGPIPLKAGRTVRVQSGTADVISYVLTGLKIT